MSNSFNYAMSRVRQSGFTLLEAIVAMTLLSVVSGVLLAWLNTSIKSIERVEISELRIRVIDDVRAYMESVNPMLTPEGQVWIGEYQIAWDAKPVTDVIPSRSIDGATIGVYDLALYAVDVEISGPKMPRYAVVVERVGFKRIRHEADY